MATPTEFKEIQELTEFSGNPTASTQGVVQEGAAAANKFPLEHLKRIRAYNEDASGGVVTVDLEAVADWDYEAVYIKDENGFATTNNITVNAAGGDLIDGVGSFVLDNNYEAILAVKSGANSISIVAVYEGAAIVVTDPAGSIFLEDNATDTSIAGANTWTKVAGTSVAGFEDDFSMSANGTLRYDGTDSIKRQIIFSFDIEKVGGGLNDFEVAIFYNAAQASNSKIFTELSKDTQMGVVVASLTLSTNDTIEPYVRNLDDADDVLFRNYQIATVKP